MAYKKQLKKAHFESGRSLLEALGVLAIMAIISAGGIIGYSAAMRKHHANDLLDRLMKRAMDASTQAMTGGTPDLSNWPNDGKYVIDPNVQTDASTFTLLVHDVPTDICEQINTLNWPLATITPEAGSCWESADMTFEFNKDLKPRSAGSSGGTEGGEEGGETNACTPYEGDPCIASCTVVDEQASLTYAEGATCGTNMVCDNSGTCGCATGFEYDGNGGCAEINPNRYCLETDENGSCTNWQICGTTNHTGKRILQVPYAYGTCATSTQSIYCSGTDDQGRCAFWQACNTTNHTGERIIGVASASGNCAENPGTFYCYTTNASGQCTNWQFCDTSNSGEQIIGTPNATGTCGGVIYCGHTNSSGQCVAYRGCRSNQYLEAIIGQPNDHGQCCSMYETKVHPYCIKTNSNGTCDETGCCESSVNTDDVIRGYSNMNGVCCSDSSEIYCKTVNQNYGTCVEWGCCGQGQSTRDLIVEGRGYAMYPDGVCCNELYTPYCSQRTGNGIRCLKYGCCKRYISSPSGTQDLVGTGGVDGIEKIIGITEQGYCVVES